MPDYTIIDSFTVPHDGALTAGTWFVLESRHGPFEQTPRSGQLVTIRTPSGSELPARVSRVEERHGSIALQFSGVGEKPIPRLSHIIFAIGPNGG